MTDSSAIVAKASNPINQRLIVMKPLRHRRLVKQTYPIPIRKDSNDEEN
jgi:hypothetical protein